MKFLTLLLTILISNNVLAYSIEANIKLTDKKIDKFVNTTAKECKDFASNSNNKLECIYKSLDKEVSVTNNLIKQSLNSKDLYTYTEQRDSLCTARYKKDLANKEFPIKWSKQYKKVCKLRLNYSKIIAIKASK